MYVFFVLLKLGYAVLEIRDLKPCYDARNVY